MKTLQKTLSGLLILTLFVPNVALFGQISDSAPESSLSSLSEPSKNIDSSVSQVNNDSGISVEENIPKTEEYFTTTNSASSENQLLNASNIKPEEKDARNTNSQYTLIPGTRTPELTYRQNIDSKVDTFSGALVQSVPIQIPNSRNGLQLNISLDYNSQNQDPFSQVGFGWSLSIPSIDRVNKTGIERLYIDNYFTSSLSGELASTTNLSEYRAKSESGDFLKYIFLNNVWTVIDKKGTTYTFGATEASRQFSASSTASTTKWMLSEVRDTNNNFYRYEYVKDGNEVYPSKVLYTGNGTQDGIYTVEFILENRPDTYVSYKKGYKVEIKKRIKEILVKVSGVERGKYVLGYTSGANNTRSLLASVTESKTSESGSVTIMPVITFQYTNDPVVYVGRDDNSNQATRSGYFQSGRVPIDFDGNGLNEKVASYSMDYNNGVSTGSMYGQSLNLGEGQIQALNKIVPSPWTTGPNGFPEEFANLGTRIFDVNGDLLPDIIFSAGSVLASTTELILNTNPYSRSSNVYLNTNEGSFSTSTYIQNSFPTFKYFNITGPYYYLATGAAQLANVNGDQIIDTYSVSTQCQSPNTIYDYGYCSKNGPYLGTGYGWKLPPARGFNWSEVIPTNNNSATVVFGDVNGDGLDDLIKESGANVTSAYLNLGNNLWSASTSSWTIPHPLQDPNAWPKYDQGVRTVDVNGDGLLDIVRSYTVNIPSNTSNMTYSFTGQEMPFPTQGNVRVVYLNTGSDWQESVNLQPCSVVDNIEIIAFNWRGGFLINDSYFDANGDGLTDCGNNIRQGRKPDMLVKTTYSTGAVVDVEYKPTPQHVKPRGTTGFFDQTHPTLPSVIYTVTKVTKNSGNENPSEIIEYSYEGGKNDFRGPNTLKFAGFKKVTETTATGKKVTYFHQGDNSDASLGEQNDSYAKIGKVFREDITDTQNNLFKRTWYKWNDHDRGNGAWLVTPHHILTQNYDGNQAHTDIAVTTTYDTTNGNLLTTTEWGEVLGTDTGTFTDTLDDKQTTTITYATSDTQSHFAPKEVVKTNKNDVVVQRTKLYYDNLPHGSLTKGNNTKQEAFKDPTTSITTRTVYNEFGLPIETYDGNNKKTAYTYDTYNLYPKTITNPLGHVTTYTYDYLSGKPVVIVDPNRTIKLSYDGLGRPLSERIVYANGTEKMKTQYQYVDTPLAISTKVSKYVSDSDTQDEYTYFDGFKRPIQTKKEFENGQWATIDTGYGPQGEIAFTSLPYFTSAHTKTPSTTEQSLKTTYAYDSLQRVIQERNALGVTSTEYAGSYRTVTNPLLQRTRYKNDAFGNLTEVMQSLGLTDYTTSYYYNANKNLVKIIDADNNVRNFEYDWMGCQTKAEDLRAPSDTSFAVYQYVYDDNGNVITKILPDGRSVTYTYDDLNRLTYEKLSGTMQVEVTNTYDSCTYGIGKLCVASTPDHYKLFTYTQDGFVDTETVMHDGTSITKYTYTPLGNIISITNPDDSKTLYAYDAAGYTESIRHISPTGATSSIITQTEYAPTGLPITQVHGNGTKTCLVYDQQKLYRLLSKKTVGVDGTCTGGTQLAQSEAFFVKNETLPYESLEQKIQRLLKEGKAVINEKGEVRLVVSEILEKKDQYVKSLVGYNADYNEIYEIVIQAVKLENNQNPEVTDKNAISGFDEQSQGAAVVGYAVSFSQARNYPHGIIEGSLATVGVQSGLYKISRYFLSFDTSILPDAAVATMARIKMYSRPYSISSGYVGIVEGQQVSGTTLAYTDYPKCGNSLNNPVIGGQKNVSEINYNQYNSFDLNQNGLIWINPTDYSKFCMRASADIENSFNADTQNDIGASFHHEGDPSRKHSILIEYIIPGTNIINNFATTSVTNLSQPTTALNIQAHNYTYDAVGNILTISSSLASSSPQTTTYTYDNLNRLLSATSLTASESFTYDGKGNILTRNGTPYVYETPNKTNPHAVTKIGNISLTYDVAGNVLTIGEQANPTTNIWNYKNELVQTSRDGVTVDYLYDTNGARISKIVDGLITKYPSPYFSHTNTGTTTTFVMSGNDNLATITNGSVLWNHTDHLGSTVATTNQTGGIVETTDYTAFGHQKSRSTHQNTQQTEKYTGHTYDPETDLLYAQARYYRGSLGRFLSQDPLHWNLTKEYLADPQQQNSYSYARNNPLKFIDSTGKYIESVIDLAFIGYDLAEIGYYKATGNTQAARESSVYLGLDLAGLAAPGVTGLGVTGRVGKAAAQAEDAAKMDQGVRGGMKITDDMLVCRGGSCTAEQFINGKGVTKFDDGTLNGVSVNIGKNIDSLKDSIPHSKIGITTFGSIKKAGGSLNVDKNIGNNVFHGNLNGLNSNQLQKLFTPTVKNNKKK